MQLSARLVRRPAPAMLLEELAKVAHMVHRLTAIRRQTERLLLADCVSSTYSPTAVTRLASANYSKAAIGGEYEVVLSARSRHPISRTFQNNNHFSAMDEAKPEVNVINIKTNRFGFLSQSFFHNFLISW